ncbi:MAG: thiol:disulfide interchange protein DsbA/DsbL [Thiobacillaceae bacterium]|nr:thiol:disulfide interchange protein DsbA/DsbL [Thiobacillaceae bacterium]MDW8323104.1 thiol:disulfide interchange protein DsbA/DsbL [Burkholderiales bacterium]
MSLLRSLFFFLLPLLLLPAQAAEWGKDYVELSPAQPVDVPRGKVEVIEFFWYRCPHCAELEPELEEWAKRLPPYVVLRRQPAVLGEGWVPLTRAYYALEAVGALRLHGEVFRAIHRERIDLNDPETFFDWAAARGVDRKKLAEAYHSFAVSTKVARAKQLSARYKVNGVPAFVVNGKYQTSAYLTGSHKALFRVLDALIAQEHGKR